MSTPVFATRLRFFRVVENARRYVRISHSVKLVATSVLASTCFCLVTTFFVGCTTTPKVKLPEVIGDDPSNSELLEAVNGNSQKIDSIYASSASLGVEGESGWVKSQIFFDRPDKLRLRGSAPLIGNAIDCGCDGEKFWYWSHFTNPDELYYCRLDQYQNSSFSDLLPLDPTWFPELFGVVDIKEADVVQGPTTRNDGKIQLVCKEQRKDGLYYKKYLFEPKTAAIVRQDVQTNGETILSVETKDFQLVDGVVLPKKLEIFAPSFGRKLYVDLESATLNDSSKFVAATFTQPTDLSAKTIDLASKTAPRSNVNTDASVSTTTNTETTSDLNTQPSAVEGTGQVIDASKLPQSQKGFVTQDDVEQFPTAAQIKQNADAVAANAVSMPVATSTVVSSEARALQPNVAQPNGVYASNDAGQAYVQPNAAVQPDVVSVPQTAYVASTPTTSVPAAVQAAPQTQGTPLATTASPSFVAPQVTSTPQTQVQNQQTQVRTAQTQTRQATRPQPVYPGFTPEEQAQVPQTTAPIATYATPQSTYPSAGATAQFAAPQTNVPTQTFAAPQSVPSNAWTNADAPQAPSLQQNELLLDEEFAAPEPEPLGDDFPELAF